MIQELKIKNFLSFKDEVKFSFEASNDKFAEDSQVVTINVDGGGTGQWHEKSTSTLFQLIA